MNDSFFAAASYSPPIRELTQKNMLLLCSVTIYLELLHVICRDDFVLYLSFFQDRVSDVCCEYVLLSLVNKQVAFAGQWWRTPLIAALRRQRRGSL